MTIVRDGNFTNILGINQEEALKLLDDKKTDGFKLRYKLQWRPPMRLLQFSKRIVQKFTLFLFTGWGEKVSIVDDEKTSTTEPFILTLIGNDMKQNVTREVSHRSNWTREASIRMARIHQKSYLDQTYDVSSEIFN